MVGRMGCVLGFLVGGLALSVLLLAGGAAFLIGFSKTGVPGAGMPAIAMMAEAFPGNARLSVGAMVPLLILGDIFAIVYYRRHADWKQLLDLIPYVVVGMVPGYFVLANLTNHQLQMLIGLIILSLLALHFAHARFGWHEVPNKWWFAALMGLIAGFGTVVGNAAGPAMAVYFLAKKFDKYQFIGTGAWFFFCVNMSKVPMQMWILPYFKPDTPVITAETLTLDLTVAPMLVIGALIGVAAHKRIPQKTFNTLVLLLAAIFAMRLIYMGASGLLG